ncbi:MAG: type II toxin-antitoxin system death-on-curing family toxin [Gemmatimonadota bacterium]|jgi:death-on-curing protein
MPRRRSEPLWLTPAIVMAIHEDLLQQHGGLAGVRDAGLVHSALARPQHRWVYGEASDVFAGAAAYGFGIAKNHGFSDGNKRTAFQAMFTFLGLNGVDLIAPEPAAVTSMLAVADGSMTEDALADWLRENSKRRRRTAK